MEHRQHEHGRGVSLIVTAGLPTPSHGFDARPLPLASWNLCAAFARAPGSPFRVGPATSTRDFQTNPTAPLWAKHLLALRATQRLVGFQRAHAQPCPAARAGNLLNRLGSRGRLRRARNRRARLRRATVSRATLGRRIRGLRGAGLLGAGLLGRRGRRDLALAAQAADGRTPHFVLQEHVLSAMRASQYERHGWFRAYVV